MSHRYYRAGITSLNRIRSAIADNDPSVVPLDVLIREGSNVANFITLSIPASKLFEYALEIYELFEHVPYDRWGRNNWPEREFASLVALRKLRSHAPSQVQMMVLGSRNGYGYGQDAVHLVQLLVSIQAEYNLSMATMDLDSDIVELVASSPSTELRLPHMFALLYEPRLLLNSDYMRIVTAVLSCIPVSEEGVRLIPPSLRGPWKMYVYSEIVDPLQDHAPQEIALHIIGQTSHLADWLLAL